MSSARPAARADFANNLAGNCGQLRGWRSHPSIVNKTFFFFLFCDFDFFIVFQRFWAGYIILAFINIYLRCLRFFFAFFFFLLKVFPVSEYSRNINLPHFFPCGMIGSSFLDRLYAFKEGGVGRPYSRLYAYLPLNFPPENNKKKKNRHLSIFDLHDHTASQIGKEAS